MSQSVDPMPAPDVVDDADADRRIAQGSLDARPAIGGPHAWLKACGVCAFRADDPQRIGADRQRDLRDRIASGDLAFHCLHRTAPCGGHRICAAAEATARRAAAGRRT